MAVIETWLHQDADSLVEVVPLKGNLFYGDNEGNLIGVEVTRAGAAVSLPSGCYGFVLRSDGSTEYVQGTVSGNKAWIILPTGCYAKVGPIGIVIKTGATKQGNKAVGGVTLAACTGYVYKTHTDTIVDPEGVLPDIGELEQAIANCIAATTNAEKVNISQSKNGNTITVTTTNRNGQSTNKTLTEPVVTVKKHGTEQSVPAREGDFDITVISPNASGNIVTNTVTIPNPNAELSDRAHVNTVSRLKTRTGNPIKIEDAVNEIADKTVIKLVPKQDLHGYSRPWVGGAGKNKLDETSPMRGCYTQGGVFLTDGTYPQNYISYKLTLPAGTYTFSTDLADCFVVRYFISDVRTEVQRATQTVLFTLSAEAEVRFSLRNTSTSSIASVTPNSMIEVGSTATAFEPFTNLCPISGYDTVNVGRVNSKNLFIINPDLDGYIGADGVVDGFSQGYKHTPLIKAKPSTTYTLSLYHNGVSEYKRIHSYKADGTWIEQTAQLTTSNGTGTFTKTFTTPSGTAYIAISYSSADSKVQVEEGSTATEYDIPAVSYPIAVSLATNGNQTAGTVYSGTVTLLADGSGQVVADHKYVEFDGSSDESWTWQSENSRAYIVAVSGIKGAANTRLEIKSNFGHFPGDNEEIDGIFGHSSGRVYYYPLSSITSAAELKTFLAANNLQIVYELATPVTYTLTANQVQTLLGYNYIYTDGAEIDLTYRQESLATNETLLKLLPTGTATGNPVTFSDGADGVPLKQLVVNVQPNQDLHGYDKPWVGGAGKNLLKSVNGTDVISSCTFTINNGKIVVTGTSTSALWFRIDRVSDPIVLPAGNYIISASGLPTNTYVRLENGSGTNYDVTPTVTSKDFTSDGTNSLTVNLRVQSGVAFGTTGTEIYIMIRKASDSDATWVPYENICPIWGWDSVPLLRTGKNLFDVRIGSTANKLRGDDGTESRSTSSSYTDPICGFAPNTQYTLQGTIIAENQTFRLYFLDANKNFLSRTSSISSTPYTFTTPDDCYYVQIQYITTKAVFSTIQIEEGTTATAFEPFKGKVYDISIPSEAGTVYGGTITLDENGEGELIVTYKSVRVGDLPWALNNNTNVFYCMGAGHKTGYDGIISSHYKTVSTGHATMNDKEIAGVSDSNAINLKDTSYSTVASMANNDAQIVYELATPVSYHLTADQVKTLLGTNIISSDAGNVEVEYFKKLSDKGTGEYSHVEGRSTIASGLASHAEGDATEATGASAHSEGYSTHATGNNSHAEGMNSTASGEDAHAEGFLTTASGGFSHAEGSTATASGQSSHAEGKGTTANHLAQHVFGIFNVADPSTAAATAKGNYVEIVGNGESVSAKHNARTLDWNGNEWLAGKLTMGASPTNDMDAIPLGLLPTGSATGNPITLMDGSKDLALKQLRIKIEPKQGGSGTPSPTNIRPISGYNSINIIRTGRNLIDNKAVSGTVKNVAVTVNDDGTVKLNGTANGDGSITLATGISIKSGYDYTLTGCPSGGVYNSTYWLNYFGDGIDEDGNDFFVMVNDDDDVNDVGIDSSYDQIGSVSIKFKNGTVFNDVVFSPMIYRNDLSKVYERGDTKTYTVSLPSAAGTVYSGELVLNSNGEGELKVDRAIVDFGNMTWNYVSNKYFQSSDLTSAIKKVSNNNELSDAISSAYRIVAWSDSSATSGCLAVNTTGVISCINSSYTDVASFKAGNAGVQLCYSIANPVTYTLTTEQVKTILGINIISSDAGSMDAIYCRALVGSPDLSNYATELKVDQKIASGINEDGLLVLDLGSLHGQNVSVAELGGIKYGRYKAIAIEVGRPDYFNGDVTVTTNNYSFNVAYRLKSSGNASTMKIILRKVYKVRTYTNLGTSSISYTDNDLPLTNTTVFKVGS